MKKITYTWLIYILQGLIFMPKAYAQLAGEELSAVTLTSGSVTVCGTDAVSFTINLENHSTQTLESVVYFPQMKPGMEYVPNSATNMTPVAGAADLSFDIGSLSAGQQISLSFQATANCSLLDYLKSSGLYGTAALINADTKFTYAVNTDGTLTNKEYLEPDGSDSYNVQYPELQLFVEEADHSITPLRFGVPVNRRIRIKNTGNGALSIDKLKFSLAHDPELSINQVVQTNSSWELHQVLSQTTVGSTLEYAGIDLAVVGDGDALFETNEVIYLKDEAQVNAENPAAQTDFWVSWGCNAVVCNPNDPDANASAYIVAASGMPSIDFQNYEVITPHEFCSTVPGTVKYTVSNNGSGNINPLLDAAFDLSLNIQLPTVNNTPGEAYYIYNFYLFDGANRVEIPEANITYGAENDFSFFNSQQISIHFKNIPLLESFGLADLDSDGHFDDLAVGSSLNLFLDYTLVPNGEIKSIGKDEYLSSGNVFPNYYWSTYSNTNQGTSVGAGGFYRVSLGSDYLQIKGNQDLIGEGTYEFFIPKLSYSPFLKEGSGAFVRHQIIIPPYVKFISAVANGVSVTPESTVNSELVFKLANQNTTLKLVLSLDCTTGSFFNEKDAILWNTFLFPGEGCAEALFQFHEQIFEIYNHCKVSDGFTVNNFTLERNTFGWEEPSNGYYSYKELFGFDNELPTAKKTDKTTSGIWLDVGLPLDEVVAKVDASLPLTAEGIDAASIEFSYDAMDPYDLAVSDIFDLDLSKSYFVVNGVNRISFPSNTLINKSIVGEKVYLKFGLVNYLPSPGDKVEVVLSFNLNDKDPGSYKFFTFNDVRANIVTEGVENGVGLGNTFHYLNPREVYINGGTRITCDSEMVLHSWFSSYRTGFFPKSGYFPNEFRPMRIYKGFEATAPYGYRFGKEYGVHLNNKFALPADVISVSADGKNISIKSFENFPVFERSGGDWLVQLLPEPAEHNEDSWLYVNQDFFVVDYPYLDKNQHVAKSFSDSKTVLTTTFPVLSLAAYSVQEAYQKVVSWPISLQNTNTDTYAISADNSWIAVEVRPEDYSIQLVTPTDGNGNALPFHRYGLNNRNMLIKVGSIPRGEIKNININAEYEHCNDNFLQDIDIYASWNCNGYPAPSLSTVKGMANDNLEILQDIISLRYKTANLQWTVNKPGAETDLLCASVPFEIDLLSSKYADMSDLELAIEMPAGVDFDNPANQLYFYPNTAAGLAIPFDEASGVLSRKNGQVKINIDKLIGGPLVGTRLEGQNTLKFDFSFMTDCSFDAGNPLLFVVSGQTNCGDPVSRVHQQRIRFAELSLDNLVMSMQASEFASCDASSTLSLSLQNLGTEASTENKLDIYLPAGLSYLELVNGNGVTGEPLVMSLGPHQVLSWNLPAAYLQAGETKEFSILTKVGKTRPAYDDLPVMAAIEKSAAVTCSATGQTCDLKGTVAKASFFVDWNKHFPLVEINASTEGAVCLNTEVQLTANVQNDCQDCTYLWTPTNETSASINVSPVQNTEYSVTVTRPDGCADQASYFLEVKEDTENIPLVEIEADKDCAVPKVVLSVPEYEAFTYQWYQGNTAIEGANEPFYEAFESGNYKVVLNGLSCGRASESLPVSLEGGAPDASFTMAKNEIEVGKTLELSIDKPARGNYYRWIWGDGKRKITFSPSAAHKYLRPGKYTLTLEVRNFASCQLSSSSQEVVVIRPLCVTVVPQNGGQFYMDKASGKIIFKKEDCPGELSVACLSGQAEPGHINSAVAASATTFADEWEYEESSYEKHGRSFPENFNEFEKGKLGRWRPKAVYTYNTELFNNSRNYASGTFRVEEFNYTYEDANHTQRWLKSNSIQQYSPHGEPLVERNILDISSVAKYGYNDVLPYLTAKNAEYTNVLFESFENVYLNGNGSQVFEDGMPYNTAEVSVDESTAHAGQKSLKLNGNYPVFKIRQMELSNQSYQQGLIVKFWIKAAELDLSKLKLKLLSTTNRELMEQEVQKVAQTGEWSLCQVKVVDFKSLVPGRSFTPALEYEGTAEVYIDDIRVQPADAQMTTYVYDTKSLRLLTIFDDQHFGLYYQYNEEGKLVRKQIETERGLQTVQENHYNTPKSNP